MNTQDIIICHNMEADLQSAIEIVPHHNIFIITDTHTQQLCLPLIASYPYLKDVKTICIGAEDANKNLHTLAHVWTELSNNGATRHSLVINLGGGMVTDLGGFAAATFKRGIRFINIPTTLLAMVDAAVGGKTGINFNGFKNEIGSFYTASSVIISSQFLRTLDSSNLLSGYAEMLKHGLISKESHWAELLRFDMENIQYDTLQQLIAQSIHVKEQIVKQDPYEQGIRKALNLGHTIGHAFESLALAKGHPVLHGYAVAWGMVCELYLSFLQCGFPKDKLYQTIDFIKSNYGRLAFTCKDYDQLFQFMRHDKKNLTMDEINFTLLSGIGQININQKVNKDTIFELLDFYSETMG